MKPALQSTSAAGGAADDALAPAGISRWGLTLGVVAIGVEALVVSPVLGDISSTFDVGPAAAGWTVTVYGLALAGCSPLFALGGQRLSRKAVMALGMALFVVAGVLCALANSFAMLLLARALCGAAAGAYLPTCYAYVADTAAYAVRGKVMGRVMAGWSIALIVGIPLGSAAAQAFGWRSTFLIVAVLGLIALVQVLRLPAHRTGHETQPLLQQALAVLRSYAPLLLLVNFFDMLGFYGVYTYLGDAARVRLQSGSAVMGMFVLFYGLGLLLSTMNAGVLDRFGKLRVVQVSLLALSALLVGLASALGSSPALAATMLAWGWFQGLVQTGTATALSQASGSARSLGMACLSCTTYLAVTVGSAAGGAVYEAHGFSMLSMAGGVCALLACLASLPLLRKPAL